MNYFMNVSFFFIHPEDGERGEQVNQFKYLGSRIAENGSSRTEIRYRIGMAMEVLSKKNVVLTRSMNKDN